MLFLDLTTSCKNVALSGILSVVKNMLSLIQIIGPILAILSLIYTFVMIVRNPDEKKYVKRIKNSLLALAIVFFIPMVINVLVGILGDSTEFSSCWNGTYNNSGNAEYMEIEPGRNRSNIYYTPNNFERGTAKASSDSGDSQGNGNVKSTGKTVFIGDSRTVQMYAYKSGNWTSANFSQGGVHEVGNDVYVAEGSMGLNWLKSTGIPNAKSYFTSGNAIVILMGVNDLSNSNNYVSYINDNAGEWKKNGCSLYFVSVNPCDGSYSNLNSSIASFNTTVKRGLNSTVGWIDTNSNLSFNTTDGLHYDGDTSNSIYNYIKGKV